MNRPNYNHIQGKVAPVPEYPLLIAQPRKNLNLGFKSLESKSPQHQKKPRLVLEPSASTPISRELKSNRETVSPMKGIKKVEKDIFIDNDFFKTLN
jgi:hypothetical protein